MSKECERELGRRALIKWSLAAGAALGVTRSGILDVLDRSAPRGIAEAAAATPTRRSVHIRAGTGGLAWFQLMWPHNDVAAANDPSFAWHLRGQQQVIQGTAGALTVGADTAFRALPVERQITAMMAGANEQHTDNPTSIARSVTGGSLFAIASVLQANTPSVVPVIALSNLDVGVAPGAPLPSIVPTADDIVGLFNSAASRAGSLLEHPTHADLYRAQYATLASLNRASGLSTTRSSYRAARNAARFLGTNLAARLAFRPGIDDVAYGMTSSMFASISNDPSTRNRRDALADFGKALAVTAKAFEMGLTASVVLPSLRDDPHGAFGGGGNLTAESTAIIATLRIMLDAFLADLGGRHDSVTGAVLADEVILTIEGDTPKDPLTNVSWPDDTPQNSNWMFVLGGGSLKTGWLGGIDRNNQVTGFDPATGAAMVPDQALQAKAAVAAVAYAITRGDIRRVQDFSSVDIGGIIA